VNEILRPRTARASSEEGGLGGGLKFSSRRVSCGAGPPPLRPTLDCEFWEEIWYHQQPMQCDVCQRILAADEPVWRLRPGPADPKYRLGCGQCRANAKWDEPWWWPPLGAPDRQQCSHCCRLVHNPKLRKGAEFVCSPECRKAVRYARRRRFRPRVPCIQCATPFVPKRRDERQRDL